MWSALYDWMAGDGLTLLAWVQGLAVPSFGIVLTVVTVRLKRRDTEMASSVHVSGLRREWESLHAQWISCLLLFRGPGDYYVDATLAERERVRDALGGRPPLGQLAKRDALEGTDMLTREIELLRGETANLRAVTMFLAHCSELVVTGRIGAADVYRILGPAVASHGRSLRWVCGALQGEGNLFQVQDHRFHGEQELVLALIDLLWAEVAKWGDNEPHSIASTALHKKISGSGRSCRRRVARLARERGVGLVGRRRLRRLLRFAEYPPFESTCRDDALHEYIDARVMRRGRLPLPLARLWGFTSTVRWKRRMAERDRIRMDGYRAAARAGNAGT